MLARSDFPETTKDTLLNMIQPGCLILIVGPSGVGKDSLINGFRSEAPGGFFFPRRSITRPKTDDSEDFIPVAPKAFDPNEYWVAWEAHGLSYGVPDSVQTALAAGQHVMVNASRNTISLFESLHNRILVLNVTATPEAIAARLAARGRETEDEIRARLARSASGQVTTAELVNIDNSSDLATAQQAFNQAVESAIRA